MSNIPNSWGNLDHREGVASQGHMQESSDQKHSLGARLAFDDGRVFHYAKNGAVALAAGKLVGSPQVASEIERTITVAASTGATQVTMTAVGTITENQYADGFMHIIDSDANEGQGFQYKIKSHPAIAAGATGVYTLYDPIVEALTTTSDILLTKNMYSGSIINPNVILLTLGVPTIDITANYYYWVQTWGVATVLCGDSTGNAATERWCHPATSTGEFLTTAGGVAGTQIVGQAYFDNTDYVDGDYWPIYLTCAP